MAACLPVQTGGGGMARTATNNRSCMDADCSCCEQWQEIADRSLSVAERLARIASALAGKNTIVKGSYTHYRRQKPPWPARTPPRMIRFAASKRQRPPWPGTTSGWPGPTRISTPKTTRSRPYPTRTGCVRVVEASRIRQVPSLNCYNTIIKTKVGVQSSCRRTGARACCITWWVGLQDGVVWV